MTGTDSDAVRRGYDAIAATYGDERDDDPRERFSQLLDRLSNEPRVLDAGCGNGRPVLAVLDREGSAVGLDFSHEQVRRAAANVPNAMVVQGGSPGSRFPPTASTV